jgi:CheY-like chemotaxis protein
MGPGFKASMQVLVVEDESIIRLGITVTLGSAGYEVLEAANADEAIAILETNSNIRFVVTDIHMPGTMDGLRLAHYVREHWPPIHLIVVSADPEPSDLPKRAKFLRKPYGERVLLSALAPASD